ncbi:MAG: ABC transporter ATP-binding protein [Dehalococcoidales bacterium]|jgi:branched-chain amino acid transport system ATP-binding protein|nr:ABC transporter ATP-binding protein [Dehalococcoidales bacterium]
MKILECKNVTKRFGGLVAVNQVSFEIEEGAIFGLIGPNGSGKTTLFNCISKVYKNEEGQVSFRGEDITSLPPYAIAARGLGRTYQGSKVFPNLTLLDNVIIGRHCRTKSNLFDAIFMTSRARREDESSREKSLEILELLGLLDRREQRVRDLPYALRAIAGMGIALASEPKLLMLDEPVAGLNPSETMAAMAVVKRVRDTGVTIFIVEHNMQAIMSTCEQIMVLSYGQKLAEGNPQQISTNSQVIEAYLGRGYAED